MYYFSLSISAKKNYILLFATTSGIRFTSQIIRGRDIDDENLHDEQPSIFNYALRPRREGTRMRESIRLESRPFLRDL